MTGRASVVPRRGLGGGAICVFSALGFGLASWAAQIPQLKAGLGLTASGLGLVLMALSGGSVIALPVAGSLVARHGSATVTRAASGMSAAGLAAVGVGSRDNVALVVAGLFTLGLATGMWEVALNVQGAAQERAVGRSVLPYLHGWYSFGTVIGALVGVGMVALRVSAEIDLPAVGGVLLVLVVVASSTFIHDHDDERDDPVVADASSPGAVALECGAAVVMKEAFASWREPRTLLIGTFVAAFALSEGSGNDWISVDMIDGHHTRPVVGTLAYGLFLVALTCGRWGGPHFIDRYGRTAVARTLGVTVVVGLAVFIFGRGSGIVLVGVFLWGFGTSLAFPLGIAAGTSDPARTTARVGVITSVAYVGFLGGPPLIGLLAGALTLLHSLLAVAGVVLVATSISGILQPTARAAL